MANRLTDLRSLLNSGASSSAVPSTSSSNSRRRHPPRLPLGGLLGGTVTNMRNSSEYYKKTVCLLNDPDERKVPLQKKKLKLYLDKNIIEAVPIKLTMNNHQLKAHFKSIFAEKLGMADLSIKINVGGDLVTPNLMPGQQLSALALKEVTGSSRYVFLVPSRRLPQDGGEISDEDLPSLASLSGADEIDEDIEIIDDFPQAPTNTTVAQPTPPTVPTLPTPPTIPTQPTESDSLKKALDVYRQSDVTDAKELLQLFLTALIDNSGGRELEVSSLSEAVRGGRVNSLDVYRCDALNSASTEILESIEDGEFDCRWPLKIDFVGEGTIDVGGPRKEFFQIVMQEVKEKLVIDGVLFHKQEYKEKNFYYAIGILLGLSLYQRGPIPRLGIDLTKTESEVEKQLYKGLERVGLAELLKKKTMYDLVHSGNTSYMLSTRTFTKLFSVALSPTGTSRHHVEVEAHKQFNRYCKEVHAGRRLDGRMTLNQILQFVTGSRDEPLLGFTLRPKIEFVEEPLGFFPTSNTCANLLKLPRPSVLDGSKADSVVFSIYDHAFAQEYFGKS